MKRPGVLVLMSGGLDSAVLLADCLVRRRRVVPVFVRSGLRWEKVELYWLRRYLDRLRRRGAGNLGDLRLVHSDARGLLPSRHWAFKGRVPSWRASWDSIYLPGRNLLLLSQAAALAACEGLGEIVLGTLSSNPFGDSRPRFFRVFARAAGLGLGTRLVIRAPFARLSKEDVVHRGRNLPLGLTFSCIWPRGRRHCGKCTKCFERRRAFRRAGVADPTRYRAPR